MRTLALPDTQSGAAGRSRPNGARRFLLAQWIPTAAVAILLPLGGLLWVSGTVPQTWSPFGPTGPGIPLAALPGLAIVALLIVLLPRTLGRAQQLALDTVEPLGLSPLSPDRSSGDASNDPADDVGSPAFEGDRLGRHIVVRTWPQGSAVLVTQDGASCSLSGGAGRLHLGDGTPASVREFVAALPADRRWNRVTVTCGTGGIRVERRRSSLHQGWLLDLWLAERIAERIAEPIAP